MPDAVWRLIAGDSERFPLQIARVCLGEAVGHALGDHDREARSRQLATAHPQFAAVVATGAEPEDPGAALVDDLSRGHAPVRTGGRDGEPPVPLPARDVDVDR